MNSKHLGHVHTVNHYRMDLKPFWRKPPAAMVAATLIATAALGAASGGEPARAPAQTAAPIAARAASGTDADASDKANIAFSKQLLSEGRYAELDQRINGYQDAYKAGTLDELALLHLVGSVVATDPDLLPRFDAWVEAFPNSYAARVSRGIYYFKSGAQTRGTRFASHTTTAQMRGMEAYYERAQKDLQASLSMDSKPMLSYNYLIRISMNISNADATRGLLDDALKLDRVALLARRPYLNSLETRWGGSLEAMLGFVQQSRADGLNDSQLAVLQKLVDSEREWLKKYRGEPQPEAAAVDGG